MTTATRTLLIIGLSFVVMIINNGFIIAGLTTFDTAMLGDLDVSVTALKVRDTVTIFTLGVSVPLAGYLIDRFKVIPVIVAGLVMMAAGFVAYRSVQSPAQLYATHLLLGGSEAFCGVVSHVVLISRWTGRHRGLALGTLVAGSSLGNAIVPAFNAWLLVHMPWRDAILGGAVVSIAMIPLVLLIYREWPTGVRDAVRGEAPERGAFRAAYTSASFWLLSATAALTVFCVLGLSTNLALYVQRALNAPLSTASFLLFLLFMGAVAAQFAAGFAADRIGAGKVHVMAVALMATGALMLGVLPGAVAALSVTLFGAGWGANSAMLQLRPATLFAGPAIGRTLAALAVVETVGGGLGPSLTGLLYDRSGSYHASFAMIGMLTVGAVVTTAAIRRPRASAPSLPLYAAPLIISDE
jgi:MFS family permease